MAKSSKEVLFYGGLDTDTVSSLLADGDYRSAHYARGGNASESDALSLTSMLGNLLVENTDLPSGVNTVIGSAVWVEGDSILFFVHNSGGAHSIFQYEITPQTFTLVIESDLLNFQLGNKIYDARIANGILYWTDGYFESYLENGGIVQFNPPRMLNIAHAIAGYGSIDLQTFDVIKAPPASLTSLTYTDDATNTSNKLYGGVYQFTVQWVYENDEETVWSPISELLVPTKQEFISGRNYLDSLAENNIELELPTGSAMIKKIRVAVRQGNTGQFGIFSELDKALLGIGNDTTYTLNFNGLTSLIPIGLSEGLRGYDRVPQVAGTLELLPTKQLCYGQFVEGYDPIELNVLSDRVLWEVRGTTILAPVLKYYKDAGIGTDLIINSQSPLVAGSVFPYQEGDLCVFTFTNNPSILNGASSTYTYTVTAADMTAVDGLSVTVANQYIIEKIGDGFVAFLIDLGYAATGVLSGGTPIFYTISISGADIFPFNTVSMTSLFPTRPKRSLKKGATHEFGIQYYDRGMRSGGVLTSEEMNVNVPFPSQDGLIPDYLADTHSPYYVTPRFWIKHTPPEWARYYQIVTRKTTEIYDFQQRTAIALEQDAAIINTWKISLDTYYEQTYGANINHTPQKGDILRLVTTSASFVSSIPAYAQGYVEVEVVAYSNNEGVGGSECVWVTKFDFASLVDFSSGFVVEIYTPKRQAIQEPWFEIGVVKNVLNPYTEDRAHEGDYLNDKSVISSPSAGGFDFVVEGMVNILGFDAVPYQITFTPAVGADFTTTIFTAIYDPVTDTTTITVNDAADGTTYLEYTANTSQNVLLGIEAATIDVSFGDVYLRPRYTNRLPDGTYWRYHIEDPSVSDYYISNASNFGRLAIQDVNFKRRELTSIIHGGAYIDNSSQNNICSFDFNVLNKIDMSEEFGRIAKVIINGYTLKVLQARKETSVYIQRTVAVGADGQPQLSYSPSNQTFGGTNPYDSLYGTVHSGSVRVQDGQLFYYDFHSGMFIRSLNNGQQDLSDGEFKFNNYTNSITNLIAANGGAESWEVLGTINSFNNEYKCTFTGVVDEEVFTDGAVFNYAQNRWKTYVNHYAEWAENLGAVSVEFLGGELYLCDEGANLEFMGEDKVFDVTFIFNDNFQLPKRPRSFGARINVAPSLVVRTDAQASYPAMQSTMASNLFSLLENGYWVEYKRDELNVAAGVPYLATTELARVNGRELRGYVLTHVLSAGGAVKVVLTSARVNYVMSEAIV